MKTVTGLNPSKLLKESFMETLGNQNLNQNNLVQFTNDSFEQFLIISWTKDSEKNQVSISNVSSLNHSFYGFIKRQRKD